MYQNVHSRLLNNVQEPLTAIELVYISKTFVECIISHYCPASRSRLALFDRLPNCLTVLNGALLVFIIETTYLGFTIL